MINHNLVSKMVEKLCIETKIALKNKNQTRMDCNIASRLKRHSTLKLCAVRLYYY